jgi:hypothetical protein
MKKYMLMLAIALIASPALAAVNIIAVDADGAGAGLVANISYTVAGEPNKVAAFALDITVDAGTITEIGGFHKGVSVAGSAGYGIFPASFDQYITVLGDGTVGDWDGAGGNYSPAAIPGDPGAQGGIGTTGVTVELGALYKGEANAPGDSGQLLTVTCSEACNLTVTLNDIRGQVVLEGAGSPSSVNLTLATNVPIGGGDVECLPQSHPDYATWVAMEKPDCWCIKTQCHGDTDGLKEGSGITGYFRVHFNDLATLLAAWNVKDAPKGPGMIGQDPLLCADFAHDKEGSGITGYFRVHFNDLAILLASWNIKEPTKGPGIPQDCGGSTDPQP